MCSRLRLDVPEPDLSEWEALVRRVVDAEDEVRIGLVGKYVELHDAYLSVAEALRHAGYAHGVRVSIDWIDSSALDARTCAIGSATSTASSCRVVSGNAAWRAW